MEYYEDVKVDAIIKDFNSDLHQSILCYEKEFIITSKYFLGNTGSETEFMPVLLPRDEIKQITFHRIRKVFGRRRLFQGYLICEKIDGEKVEYFIGQYPRFLRTLCVLNHYQIPFVEGEDLYK